MEFPSNDALAVVAVHLALRSQAMATTKHMRDVFWNFYRDLIEDREGAVERDQIRAREVEKRKSAATKQIAEAKVWRTQPEYQLVIDGIRLLGFTGSRIRNTLLRAADHGQLRVPPAEASDAELRAVRHIGSKSLALIRSLKKPSSAAPEPDEGGAQCLKLK